MGNEADFLPASNLVVRNQTDPNHQKQSVYKYLKENTKDEDDFCQLINV